MWLAVPHDGALFRPGEHVSLVFERSASTAQLPWRRLAVEVTFDGQPLGSFEFPLGNRTMELMLGAAAEGPHAIAAEVEGRAIARVKMHVASGTLALHAGEDWQNAASRHAQLDHWGCLLLGASVSSLPSISPARPLHLWLNGERLRTDEGWLVARVAPGTLHVRGAVTDDWGDVNLENQTTVDVVLPGRPLMGDLRNDESRIQSLDRLQESALLAPAAGIEDGINSESTPTDTGSRQGRPVISCLHPTRERPNDALATRARWLAAASEERIRIEWIFAVDSDDDATRDALLEQLRGEDDVAVLSVPLALGFHTEGTCVGAWNMAGLAARGLILMAVADDFHPPQNWDEGVVRRMPLTRSAALMIPDGVSGCRVAVPSGIDCV